VARAFAVDAFGGVKAAGGLVVVPVLVVEDSGLVVGVCGGAVGASEDEASQRETSRGSLQFGFDLVRFHGVLLLVGLAACEPTGVSRS